jgi:hypothetical protein
VCHKIKIIFSSYNSIPNFAFRNPYDKGQRAEKKSKKIQNTAVKYRQVKEEN